MTNTTNKGRMINGEARSPLASMAVGAWLRVIVGAMANWTDAELIALIQEAGEQLNARARAIARAVGPKIAPMVSAVASKAPAYETTASADKGGLAVQAKAIRKPKGGAARPKPEAFQTMPTAALPVAWAEIFAHAPILRAAYEANGRKKPDGYPALPGAIYHACKGNPNDPLAAWEAAQAAGVTAASIAGKAGEIAAWKRLNGR